MVVAVPGATSERGRVAADDDLGVETQPLRRGVGRAHGVGGAQRKAVDVGAIERRHVDRRRHVVREHAPERSGERDALRRQRRKIDMARKARARLVGGDDFEELLLPRRAADRLDQRSWLAAVLSEAVAHGHGLITTSLPAGKPSLSAGTRIQPSVLGERRQRPIA